MNPKLHVMQNTRTDFLVCSLVLSPDKVVASAVFLLLYIIIIIIIIIISYELNCTVHWVAWFVVLGRAVLQLVAHIGLVASHGSWESKDQIQKQTGTTWFLC